MSFIEMEPHDSVFITGLIAVWCGPSLEAQTHGSITLVFRVNPGNIARRYMSRAQFVRAHAVPCIDINTVMTGYAKETLQLAHCRSDALCFWVDQLNTVYARPVRSWQRSHRIRLLCLAKAIGEPSVASRFGCG